MAKHKPQHNTIQLLPSKAANTIPTATLALPLEGWLMQTWSSSSSARGCPCLFAQPSEDISTGPITSQAAMAYVDYISLPQGPMFHRSWGRGKVRYLFNVAFRGNITNLLHLDRGCAPHRGRSFAAIVVYHGRFPEDVTVRK